jgi:glucokinase
MRDVAGCDERTDRQSAASLIARVGSAAMGRAVAVLDVGGTTIKTGVVTLLGDGETADEVVVGRSLPTLANDPAEVILDRLAEATDAALDLAGPRAVGVAIAICGPFDLEAGESHMRGVHKFEDIHGIDLRAALRSRSTIGDRPIRFARDAESAGTGEAIAGAGRDFDRVLTMTVGTGLGTCLTAHARPVEFVDGFGVEHVGMLETPWGRADDVLSAYGLANRMGVNMIELRSAVDDPSNASVVSEHGRRLGSFLAPLVADFDAHLVVIGGGLSAAFDRFGPALQSALGATPARPATLGPAGPLLGAATLTFT